jgi:hypothetical protein
MHVNVNQQRTTCRFDIEANGETGADVLETTVLVPVREHHSPRLLSKFKHLNLAPFRDSRHQNGPLAVQILNLLSQATLLHIRWNHLQTYFSYLGNLL